MAERVKLGEKGLPDLTPLAEGGEWAVKFPLLTSYLIDCQFNDGSPRETSKVFFRVERGKWVVILKEPNQGVMLEVAVDLPSEMFTALEAALRLERPPWRHDPYARSLPKKKGK